MKVRTLHRFGYVPRCMFAHNSGVLLQLYSKHCNCMMLTVLLVMMYLFTNLKCTSLTT